MMGKLDALIPVIMIFPAIFIVTEVMGNPMDRAYQSNEAFSDFEEKKKEVMCMEKASTEYDDMGMVEAELGLSKSEVRDLLYRLEDKGYFEIQRGIFSVDGGGSAKFYQEMKDLDPEYCNSLLEFGKVEVDEK